MTEGQFWSLISRVDLGALKAGAEEEAVAPVVERLSALTLGEMEGFEEHLARHLYALDGQVFAESAGESGESGDGFLYARCFVVACGESFYREVLADPRKFPSSLDEWCEPLLFVAPQAWSKQTGQPADEWVYITSVSYETGSNKGAWG